MSLTMGLEVEGGDGRRRRTDKESDNNYYRLYLSSCDNVLPLIIRGSSKPSLF